MGYFEDAEVGATWAHRAPIEVQDLSRIEAHDPRQGFFKSPLCFASLIK